jgi:DNA-3-methyladenine glycosylase I
MAYHDQEWGTPLRDAQGLFELLLLEGFQAGLSWITVLRKRERYREVLYGFDVQRVAQMSDAEIEELMLDPASSATASTQGRPAQCPGLAGAGRPGGVSLVVRRRRAEDQSFQGSQRSPGDHARSAGDEQGPEKGRLHLRRPDHLLRLHAGFGHGHGSHQDCDRYALLATAVRMAPPQHKSGVTCGKV